jgi:hypothetical protein
MVLASDARNGDLGIVAAGAASVHTGDERGEDRSGDVSPVHG